jgi:fructuronate reductase
VTSTSATSSTGEDASARLTAAALDGVLPRPGVTGPPRGGLGRAVGIVHLGIGAFHRAHQAVLTEDAAAATGTEGWGICGVTQRSARVADQLLPQDCRYGVLERGVDADGSPSRSLRVVGQVSDVVYPARDAERLEGRLTDENVRVITLTVTEKGYRRDAAGRLDVADPLVRADLAGGPARSAVGVLVRGLQRRAASTQAPVTVLTCDNLIGNGRVLARLVADFCQALPRREGDRLAEWIRRSVTFPNTMVDRIVPATTPADRAEARAMLGLRDEALVVAEPFRQWVIEDAFVAGRPAWERAGAQLVTDVEPFEQLKLRMLNGTHSMLAYLGALAGYSTIAQTVADERLAEAAELLIAEDVAPTLDAPPGVDVAAYGRVVLERFANPALRHLTTQIAMDGSQKLPPRLLGTVRDRLAAGATPRHAIRAVAAWMAYVALGRDVTGRPLPLDDPLAPRLRQAVAGAADAPSVVTALLGVGEVFTDDLAGSAVLRECLVEQVAELLGGRR